MANKVTIYLDIMRGNSFVKQIPYLRSGFLTKIDGNPEQILDAHEVEEYVFKTTSPARTGHKNRIFESTNHKPLKNRL